MPDPISVVITRSEVNVNGGGGATTQTVFFNYTTSPTNKTMTLGGGGGGGGSSGGGGDGCKLGNNPKVFTMYDLKFLSLLSKMNGVVCVILIFTDGEF